MRKKLIVKKYCGGYKKLYPLQKITPDITRKIHQNNEDDDNDGNDWWESDTVII